MELVLITLWLLFSQLIRGDESIEYDPYSVSARCPLSCSDDSNSWARYQSLEELVNCKQTILFDLNIYNEVDKSSPQTTIRACAVPNSVSSPTIERRQFLSVESKSKTTNAQLKNGGIDTASTNTKILRWTGTSSVRTTGLSAAASALAAYFQGVTNGAPAILFAKSDNIIVGVYGGALVEKQSLGRLASDFSRSATRPNFEQLAVESCNADSVNAQVFGIFADTSGDLAVVQNAVRKWDSAECLEATGATKEAWLNSSPTFVAANTVSVGPTIQTRNQKLSARTKLVPRATCTYTQVVAGDGCWAVAQRCSITQDQLIQFNGNPNLCNTLQPGQYVCCSAGDKPDFSPKPNADGSCKTWTVQSGDFCAAIAQQNTMTVDQIIARNSGTWGWAGCNLLQVGQVICLSTGSPPMPGAVSNAVCGPQVPGSAKPADMSTLASLNPCSLNACCNVWGQCGIDADFCVPNPADTGAPGTAKPGSNGCISNCGTSVVNNGVPPTSFMRIGYFEAWNMERPCLNMVPAQINTTYYTHVHFAFGLITPNTYQVDVNATQAMFNQFKALTNVKKIISFGGWSFSTNGTTFQILREAMMPINRQSFANTLTKFVADHGLDGVDMDWEYPGATDIPGIPAGTPADGANYLKFLTVLRSTLPADKTIGIAAPASYWYLKNFPIKAISNVVSYIVYMTYDLHGQWDYGSSFASSGCPAGNCLRSHVNKTETSNALAMITKAGVPAPKVILGMPLYGRTVRMTSPSCLDPTCTFRGPASMATAGRCTGTQGYLANGEIRAIIAANVGVRTFSDENGDVLVYGNLQWVSWLSKAAYAVRAEWGRGLGLGGVSDWAVDLDGDVV